ncbi:MAG: RNA polymerase Rpb4 family protein [Candidatus Verstraetearchaeota archaeon]|nr:RNA polymerase Rpb4 family protein [Candidatus Verstraetearchaeota archaeon]
MPREIVKEEEITLPKVKALLERRQAEGELSHLQKLTYDYVSKFSKIEQEKADALLARLKEEGVSAFLATQIVNIMPTSIEELRTIFSAESRPVLPSELEKLLSIINTFR